MLTLAHLFGYILARWVYKHLVSLSSILGPANLLPGPCPAQPTQLCPGPQEGDDGRATWVWTVRADSVCIKEEMQEGELYRGSELCPEALPSSD